MFKWVALAVGTPWLPFVVAASCLLAWWYLEWRSKSGLWVSLTPEWSAPLFATIINNDRDYSAHVKRSTLYGIRKDRTRERLYEALRFQKCPQPPFTVEPERQTQQAYGGYIPFDSYKRLQVEIELENGKIIPSRKVKPPKPPLIPSRESDTPREAERKELIATRDDQPDYSYPKALARLNTPGFAPSKAAQPDKVESPQLAALRDKLVKLLEKAERIKDIPDSPGFDMEQARRRNQMFINEVREEISRLERESFSISAEQESEMLERLEATEKVRILVVSPMKAEEAVNDFAARLYGMLLETGFTAGRCVRETTPINQFPSGVTIYSADDENERIKVALTSIRAVLNIIGVRCTKIKRSVLRGEDFKEWEIHLIIGPTKQPS